MSLAIALDKILSAGINMERGRVHHALWHVLQRHYGFDINMVIELYEIVNLDKSAEVDSDFNTQCGVCGSSEPDSNGEPTQTYHGQALHPKCASELETLYNEWSKED